MRSAAFFCLAYFCTIYGFALFAPFMLVMLLLRYVQWATIGGKRAAGRDGIPRDAVTTSVIFANEQATTSGLAV